MDESTKEKLTQILEEDASTKEKLTQILEEMKACVARYVELRTEFLETLDKAGYSVYNTDTLTDEGDHGSNLPH